MCCTVFSLVVHTLALFWVSSGFLPTTGAAQAIEDVRLDRSRPAVSLTADPARDGEYVCVELHNNTIWPLGIRTESAYTADDLPVVRAGGPTINCLMGDPEVAVEYTAERMLPRIEQESIYWCTATLSWVAPGRSVWFKVPRDKPGKISRVVVRFIYAWEAEGAGAIHYVRTKWTGSDRAAIQQPAVRSDDAPPL